MRNRIHTSNVSRRCAWSRIGSDTFKPGQCIAGEAIPLHRGHFALIGLTFLQHGKAAAVNFRETRRRLKANRLRTYPTSTLSAIQKAGYVKLWRSDRAYDLMRHHPKAFLLLTQIAMRAQRQFQTNPHHLKAGQALIGDWKSIGLTEREYRTAKATLSKTGYATFNPTPLGTIATLSNRDVYDINPEPEGQTTGQTTCVVPVVQPDDYQETKESEKSEESKEPSPSIVESVTERYPTLEEAEIVLTVNPDFKAEWVHSWHSDMVARDWKDADGKPISNWKTKAVMAVFKRFEETQRIEVQPI